MLIQIDGTFIFVIISFLIFLLIIKTILYRPITKVIKERENFYQKNSKMESESKLKSKTLIEQKENTLKQARLNAGNIIKDATNDAKIESNKKIKEAKSNLQNEICKNKNELEQESINAKIEIKNEINELVKGIIFKILKQNIEVDLKEENIKKYLNIG